MVDEQRHEIRREEDLRVAQTVEQLAAQIETFFSGNMTIPGTDKTMIETVQEHDQLFENQDRILVQQGILLDYIVGPPKIHPATGEVMINGNNEPIRDESKGIMSRHLGWRQIARLAILNLASILAGVALVFQMAG